MLHRLREHWKLSLALLSSLLLTGIFLWLLYKFIQGCFFCEDEATLILSASEYGDEGVSSSWQQLVNRIKMQPFNFVSLAIFSCAIIHTFFAPKINQLSNFLSLRNQKEHSKVLDTFGVEILRFMGEVEVIFGIWVIPLLIAITFFYDWNTALNYLSNLDYTETIFVVVIMSVASSRPIVHLAEQCMRFIARIGGGTISIWWLTILTIGPLAGSLITEPGAMTISVLLLAKKFYRYGPSPILAYATLGLLFVNISVGGVFTSFAAPAVLMVSKTWGWDSKFMLLNFGLKALLGIIASNTVFFLRFRSELCAMEKRVTALAEKEKPLEPIPIWIMLIHVVFLVWIIFHGHYPVVFVGSFLIFLGFLRATSSFQTELSLKTPMLVGFFLAGLVVHGNLQGWWIEPILGHLSCEMLMVTSIVLTAFNDNAEITFLASLIPTLTPEMKYALVAGAVTGGGLTVIANAPNPLGQALLGEFFPEGIRPTKLFLAAIIPTLLVAAAFWFLRSYPCVP